LESLITFRKIRKSRLKGRERGNDECVRIFTEKGEAYNDRHHEEFCIGEEDYTPLREFIEGGLEEGERGEGHLS